MNSTDNTGFLGNVLDWFAHPFSSTGSALNWVLFVGLLVLASFFWNLVLLDITKEV